mgnify:CR=1 FL=1
MRGDDQYGDAIVLGDLGPDSPDPYTQKELKDYSATQFYKYQIQKLQEEISRDKARLIFLEEKRRELQCEAVEFRTRYENLKSSKMNLIIEFSFIQGMSVFAGAILGFVPDDAWWRMLGWLLLGIALILSIFKGLLTSLIVRWMPAWIYEESPRGSLQRGRGS